MKWLSKLTSYLHRPVTWVVLVTVFFFVPILMNGVSKVLYGIGFYSGAEFSAQVASLVSWHDVAVAKFNKGDAQFARANYSGSLTSFKTSVASAKGDLQCKARFNGALSGTKLGDDHKEKDKKIAENYYLESLRLLLSYCADNPKYEAQYKSLEAYIRQQLQHIKQQEQKPDNQPNKPSQPSQPPADNDKVLSDEERQQINHQRLRNRENADSSNEEGAAEQDW